MFIADDPDPRLWPTHLVERGHLRIASVAEVYGDRRLVEADVQRDTFASALTEALEEGYSGIRVAADNTSLVSTPERLEAWTAWEQVAEQLMADNPVTGLCGFDRTRADAHVLRAVTELHHVRV